MCRKGKPVAPLSAMPAGSLASEIRDLSYEAEVRFKLTNSGFTQQRVLAAIVLRVSQCGQR